MKEGMMHSVVLAVAFIVATVILHDFLKTPVQERTIMVHVLWSKETVPLLPDPLLQHRDLAHP